MSAHGATGAVAQPCKHQPYTSNTYTYTGNFILHIQSFKFYIQNAFTYFYR